METSHYINLAVATCRLSKQKKIRKYVNMYQSLANKGKSESIYNIEW